MQEIKWVRCSVCGKKKGRTSGKMNKVIKGIIIIAAALLVAAGTALFCFVYKVKEPPAPQIEQTEKTEDKKIRVACIGDSITYGAGVLSTREIDSYPAILQKLLGDSYQVLNYGLSGRTLLDGGNKPYKQEDFYEETQEAEPDIVLIMLGTNDSKPNNWDAAAYEKELGEFVDLYQNIPSQPEVYLMTCCDAFATDGKKEVAFGVDKMVIGNEVNAIIQRVGENCEVPVIDIYGVTKDHPEYFADGVHPNARGNQIIAETVYQCVKLVNGLPSR
ncbi:GDSL-type esterase/lipase family protein [Muricomes sp. OA1]|uniref:GDSL-type esterase/lipase family protein n=2 Tax=Lachnospiraceae TaxID=186803 RepID=UPI000472FB26|nr:GDSL-type esterase/lipase family protein [Muricomes sp. OA1]